MSLPVVVSRIQNRRGTQDQFDGLAFSPSGPNSVYPLGYTGVGGFGSYPDFDAVNYPNVLMPGELALCTDSRKIYMGNLNGEFLLLADVPVGGQMFPPVQWVLPPSDILGVFQPVEKTLPGPTTVIFEYDATPFFNVLYDITDFPSNDVNQVGTSFSRNGEFKITAVIDFAAIPNPPYPDITAVSMTDTSTEVNVTAFDISFIAKYNLAATKIELWYMHNFPGDVILNTSTIAWLPLV